MAILKDLIVQGNSRFIGDTNLGIVKSGVWNGSTIDVSYGGTGVTSIAALFNLIRDNGGDNRWLKLSGGTMTGTVQWSGAAALPEQTNPLYFLCVDSFSSGGTTKWSDISLIKNLVEKTWSQLKAMRDGGTLIPGQQYRITDYTCTTTQADTSTAGHVFDIIVVADTASKLNENARAVAHSGDTYFANCKLEAWELKYCIDNDTNRFAWADSTNGKGVIFYMKDEFGNICGYDFKNILMKFYKITAVTTIPSSLNNTYSISKVIGTNNYTITSGCTVSSSDTEFRYTFDLVLDVHKDYSLNDYGSYKSKLCHDNKIPRLFGNSNYFQASNYTKLQYINFISFRNTSQTDLCYSNIFGNRCYNISFGRNSYFNTFNEYNYNLTFGNGCYKIIFGNSCGNNILGDSCYSIVLARGCTSIKIGSNCNSLDLGDNSYSNTFGNSCSYITFNSGCNSNTLGNYCNNILFGIKCQYIKFGDSSNTKNYYQNIIVESGNHDIYLNCTATTSSSSYYQNVTIGQGINSTYNYKTITDSNVGQTFKITYQPANSVIVSV